jgi:N-carbamoyl-L-amino-acid hydrolase
MNLNIDPSRLSDELDALAAFSADEAPAVTRIVFSQQDRQARAWLKDRCREAGLTLREDAVGNTFARWTGAEPDLPAVATGSHIDAIPHAGKYDGTVGVLGGLHAIRALQAARFTPRRSIELVLFTSEEPTRFGIGCLGSRLLSGALTPEADTTLRDPSASEDPAQQTLAAIRHQAGFTGPLASVALPSKHYSAFVELHIEQGPMLEKENIALGIVTSIAAPASFRIAIHGEGGHAGGRLMPGRRDALCAAAEIILAVERAALATAATDTVATVGICQVHPGAVNSIPSRVQLAVDLRDTDAARRDGVLAQIRHACEEVAQRRNVAVTLEMINADAPAQCSPEILAALAAACEAEGLSYRKMVSRAYHDSLFMARIAPIAMLFIPCRAGVSHRPDEYSSPEQIANGVRVLAHTLATLSNA